VRRPSISEDTLCSGARRGFSFCARGPVFRVASGTSRTHHRGAVATGIQSRQLRRRLTQDRCPVRQTRCPSGESACLHGRVPRGAGHAPNGSNGLWGFRQKSGCLDQLAGGEGRGRVERPHPGRGAGARPPA